MQQANQKQLNSLQKEIDRCVSGSIQLYRAFLETTGYIDFIVRLNKFPDDVNGIGLVVKKCEDYIACKLKAVAPTHVPKTGLSSKKIAPVDISALSINGTDDQLSVEVTSSSVQKGEGISVSGTNTPIDYREVLSAFINAAGAIERAWQVAGQIAEQWEEIHAQMKSMIWFMMDKMGTRVEEVDQKSKMVANTVKVYGILGACNSSQHLYKEYGYNWWCNKAYFYDGYCASYDKEDVVALLRNTMDAWEKDIRGIWRMVAKNVIFSSTFTGSDWKDLEAKCVELLQTITEHHEKMMATRPYANFHALIPFVIEKRFQQLDNQISEMSRRVNTIWQEMTGFHKLDDKLEEIKQKAINLSFILKKLVRLSEYNQRLAETEK
jgi:hypothetical protein